jgi:hypothetical protein
MQTLKTQSFPSSRHHYKSSRSDREIRRHDRHGHRLSILLLLPSPPLSSLTLKRTSSTPIRPNRLPLLVRVLVCFFVISFFFLQSAEGEGDVEFTPLPLSPLPNPSPRRSTRVMRKMKVVEERKAKTHLTFD